MFSNQPSRSQDRNRILLVLGVLWLLLFSLSIGCDVLKINKPAVQPNRGLGSVVWSLAILSAEDDAQPQPEPKPDDGELIPYTQCTECDGRGWLGDGQPRGDCFNCTHPKWDTYFSKQSQPAEIEPQQLSPPVCDPAEEPQPEEPTPASVKTSAGSSTLQPPPPIKEPSSTTEDFTTTKGAPLSSEHASTHNLADDVYDLKPDDAQTLVVPAPEEGSLTYPTIDGTGEGIDYHAARAKELGRYLMLVFSSEEGCPGCVLLFRDIIPSQKFQTFAKENVYLVKVDFDSMSKLRKLYAIEKKPTIVLVSLDGTRYKTLTLATSDDHLIEFVQRAQKELEE